MPARAADWPDVRLDAAAASVAGHPVSVWCENSWADWLAMAPDEDGGYTRLDAPVVYLSPSNCQALHLLLDGDDVGTIYASAALLTLAHESVHQRGITDEGVTDCTALPLVPALAVSYFGIPARVSRAYTVTVRRRFSGRMVRVPVIRHRRVANPWLARLAADAERWHRTEPAVYQGGC